MKKLSSLLNKSPIKIKNLKKFDDIIENNENYLIINYN